MSKIVSMREFARLYNMPESTLRYYIKRGIIQPKERIVKGFDVDDYRFILEYKQRTVDNSR